MSIRGLMGASSSATTPICGLRTTDIFGDSSGKALYRFDGNANDESGNFHGTETAVTYGGGAYERGAIFNGSAKVTSSLALNTANTFTYSVWVKITTVGVTSQAIIDFTTGRALLASGNGSNNYVNYYDGSAWRSFNAYSLPSNTLVHLVLVVNGTNAYLYANGELKGSSICSAATPSTPTIGSAYNATAPLTGSLDQFRIFKKALTATEVAILFAECAPTSTVDNINPFEDGSLKALYQFNGDVTDRTTIYNGTATNITYGTGKFGQCAIFNGTSSTVVNASVPSMGIYSTLSAWVYTTLTTAQAIAEYSNGANLVAVYYDATTIKVRVNALLYSVTKTIPKSIFNHIAVVLFNDVPSLYLDGVKLTLTSSAVTAIAGASGLRIGVANVATVDTFMSGNIDQVRLLNKSLTPMEVASLYNETTPLEEPMSALVDPFKDGSGKALFRLEGNVLDESGNYNGTATSITYGVAPIGREAIFNGSASITAAMALGANTFSYSTWVTVTTVGATIQSLIDFSVGRSMLSSGNGTNAYLSYYDGTTYRVFGTYALTSATRTHVGLAVNGTNVELFINGVSQGTSSCNAVTPSGTIALGKYAGSAAGYLTGREDQTRVFTRVLTASEFLQLYNQGA